MKEFFRDDVMRVCPLPGGPGEKNAHVRVDFRNGARYGLRVVRANGDITVFLSNGKDYVMHPVEFDDLPLPVRLAVNAVTTTDDSRRFRRSLTFTENQVG